jgi:Domain of unknown function (DUF5703)
VWVEPDGSLVLYLDHTDTFSEASRLLKIGKVRLRFSPALAVNGDDYRQVLRVDEGRFDLTCGGAALAVFVEPGRPVIRISGNFPTPTAMTIIDEGWRRKRTILNGQPEAGEFTLNDGALGASWTMDNAPKEIVVAESADVSLTDLQATNGIGWFHRNADSIVPLTLKHQSCQDLPGSFDPLLGRTFGAWIEGPGLRRHDPTTLVSVAPSRELDLRLTCPVQITSTASDWVAAANRIAHESAAPAVARAATTALWQGFWQRSWIHVTGETRQELPDNDHPLRLGIDSNRENRFPGELAGMVVHARVLDAAEIANLAAAPAGTAPPSIADEILRDLAPAPGTIHDELRHLGKRPGLTLAAWIKPTTKDAGRIFDQMTAGLDDGFIFDTWPGDALRLIAGRQSLQVTGILRIGTWQHVAASYEGASASISMAASSARASVRINR